MNRLSWDSTAPRRPRRSRGERRRSDDSFLAAEADLIREGWVQIERLRPRW